MLSLLRVENIAIIESLQVEFGPGLNVLTGETGAGKSIIVDAISLLLGGRASPELIRSGAETAIVEAEFDLDEADTRRDEVLTRLEVEVEDGARLALRRELSEKRSRAFVQGRSAPLSILREVAGCLVNIHGQHEHQALLDAGAHLQLLDTFAGDSDLVRDVNACAAEGAAALEALRQLELRRTDAARRRDYLQFQADEIRSAGLSSGEEESLRREKHVLLNAERIRGAAAAAAEVLYQGEGSADEKLVAARKGVEELSRLDSRHEGLARRLGELSESAREVSRELDQIAGAAEADPARLEAIEERLYLIEKLKKKYGADIPAVLQSLAAAQVELAELDRVEIDSLAAEERLASARRAYATATAGLSASRQGAAERLKRVLRKHLADLAMPSTRFEVRFEKVPVEAFNPAGTETAEFLLSPNAGEPLKPLALIASGGELSRIMLAIKNSAGDDRTSVTQIFDEIDSGIGGHTAEVVGRKLSAVSRRQQILCVTHLAQIAAFADRHLTVAKAVKGGRTTTMLEALDGARKIQELARMMGSADPSATALRHAEEMLRRATAMPS